MDAKKSKAALQFVAKKNRVSEEAVKYEIEKAAAMARQSSDPKIQAFWNSIPRQGEYPTAEEILAGITKLISDGEPV